MAEALQASHVATVIITTDELPKTENALVWAKATNDRLVKRYGLRRRGPSG